MTITLDEPGTDTRVTVGGGDETDERASGGIDILTLIDFDEPVPCEGFQEGGDKCPNEAEFKARTGCCGTQILLCEDCLLRIKGDLQRGEREGTASKCRKCGFSTKTGNSYLLVFEGAL